MTWHLDSFILIHSDLRDLQIGMFDMTFWLIHRDSFILTHSSKESSDQYVWHDILTHLSWLIHPDSFNHWFISTPSSWLIHLKIRVKISASFFRSYCASQVNNRPDKEEQIKQPLCTTRSFENRRVKWFVPLSYELLVPANPMNLQIFFSKTTWDF